MSATQVLQFGDVAGHGFHGNQYTGGMGGGPPYDVPKRIYSAEELRQRSLDTTPRPEWMQWQRELMQNPVGRYVQTGYVTVNNYLRAQQAVMPQQEMEVATARMDKLIADSKLTKPLTVYRGFDFQRPPRSVTSEKLVGRTIKDLAYTSTSSRESTATAFAAQSVKPANAYIAEIHLPMGQPALDTTSYRPSGEDEHEWLLPRATSFKITSAVTPAPDASGKWQPGRLVMEPV